MRLALLKCFDLQQIKLLFNELGLDVDPPKSHLREALAYDLVNFSTRLEPNDQLAQLLKLARELDRAFVWPPTHLPELTKIFMAPPRNPYFTARTHEFV